MGVKSGLSVSAIQTVGALQGYVRAGNGLAGVSRLAMSDRWSLGQEGGVHRGNAAVKNARQGTWHHWDAWSVPLRKEATTRGMLGAESSCSRLQPANRKPDAHDQCVLVVPWSMAVSYTHLRAH